jgi:hypothetical protein
MKAADNLARPHILFILDTVLRNWVKDIPDPAVNPPLAVLQ